MALKPYWRVPMQSLILRAEHLEIITTARSRSLHAYMNKAGYLTHEPMPLEREEPEVLREMVRIHLHEHSYTQSELAEMLGMPEEVFVSELACEPNGLRVVR
jgi:Zn-dependent peptidase ImmA (M78 family)